ncbi:MAG: hypothetical protein HFE43_07340 [Oscillospiraceae bacterium]|nr:hypothetical protein [Oscillospiraceae bacterium]
MHYWIPVAALWLAFLLTIGAFRLRARPAGRIWKRAAILAAALGGILFLWWGLARTLYSLPSV